MVGPDFNLKSCSPHNLIKGSILAPILTFTGKFGLKRLRLGYLLDTLPERLVLARRDQLDYAAFLQIILADEVTRRDNHNLEMHLQKAELEGGLPLSPDFDWAAETTVDRHLLNAAFSLDFLNRHEHVIFVGPVGVGKSFLAQALAMLRYALDIASTSPELTLCLEPWPSQGSTTPWGGPFTPFSVLTCSSWMISACRGSPPSSRLTSMS